MLREINGLCIAFLTQMEPLRVSVGLEAYAQRDPLVTYKSKASELFQSLINDTRAGVVSRLFTFRAQTGLQAEDATPTADADGDHPAPADPGEDGEGGQPGEADNDGEGALEEAEVDSSLSKSSKRRRRRK